MEIQLYPCVMESFVQPKVDIINELSENLKNFFSNKYYSDAVSEVSIGLLMTLSRPGYENWYMPKKPLYTFHKDVKSKLTGEVIEKRKLLQVEFSLKDTMLENFVAKSDRDSKVVLIEQVILCFTSINLPKKIQDFRKDDFITDLQTLKSSFV
jgi:hypothetical protein